MTKNHSENLERDHSVVGSGPGWEYRGRRNGSEVEIEVWRREDRLVVSPTGLRYLLAATYPGTDAGGARDAALLDLVVQGILVLRDRDGLPVTPEHASEQARNIVAALLGHYLIDPLDGPDL
jgi:hypothetical protein